MNWKGARGDCPARENGIPMDRKLLATSFLSGVGKMMFIAMGNSWRKVSYPAWGRRFSHRQETACEKFPARRREDGIHSNRKLFATGFLSGVGKMIFMATGNCLRQETFLSCATIEMGIDYSLLFHGEVISMVHKKIIAALAAGFLCFSFSSYANGGPDAPN